jgi:hypothetical protein
MGFGVEVRGASDVNRRRTIENGESRGCRCNGGGILFLII